MKNTLQIIGIISITCSLFSCNEPSDKKRKPLKPSAAKQVTKPSLRPIADTFTINSKTAVSFSPDKATVEKKKKEWGKENFMVSADDYQFYMNQSIEFIRKQKLTLVDAGNARYLKFVYPNHTTTIIRRDTVPELWGIYFFKPGNTPFLVDLTQTPKDFKAYFR